MIGDLDKNSFGGMMEAKDELAFLKKLNIDLSCDLAVPSLGIYQEKRKHISIERLERKY